MPDAAAAGEHGRAGLQREALDRATRAALYRLRPRLQNVDLAGRAVLAPLDVHRLTVVLLDDQRLPGERQDVRIAQRERMRRLRHFDGGDALLRARGRVYHLDGFASEVAAQDRVFPRTHRALVHVELVGIDGTLYHRLAEPVGGGDEHDLSETGVGVQSEHHTAGAEIAAHHVLHACRQSNCGVIEPLVDAIRDRAIVEQRSKHLVHRCQDVGLSAYVEKRFLLTGERSFRKILSGGGRPHRDGDLTAAAHGAQLLAHGLMESLLEAESIESTRECAPRWPRASRHHPRRGRQLLADALVQAALCEKFAVGVRGRREPARDTNACLSKGADHLPEGGILAADCIDVVTAQALKRDYVVVH